MTEYDADTTSGLMPQILAMTSPPGTRDMKNDVQNAYNGPSNTLLFGSQVETGLAAHPYFRRPGKGHNHDSCDACSEGGDLICCDICPASFHLNCHDPPLDEDNIPKGEWMCHECRVKKEDDKIPNNRNGKTVRSGKKKEKQEVIERKVWASGRQMGLTSTPFMKLVKLAALSNPKQFSLPHELTLPANFPNEPKDLVRRNGRRGWGKKKPYELDNGFTPRPAILCFQCSKSCRIGPIIPCDYCSLFYHLDCVNPPLTIPPTGKWMCPNHPEHVMDANLCSHSLTERVRIWDKFNTPMNEQSIKLSFIRKCNRQRTNEKFKVKKVTRSRIKVPNGVKTQYSDPSELLPHMSSSSYIPMPPPVKKSTDTPSGISCLLEASEYINDKAEGDNTETRMEDVVLSVNNSSPTDEERCEWLKSILQFQTDMFKQTMKPNGAVNASKLHNGVIASSSEKKRPIANGDLSSSKIPQKSKTRRSGKYLRNSPYEKPISNTEFIMQTLNSLKDTLEEKIERNTDLQIHGFDKPVLEVLAYERLLSLYKSSEIEKLQILNIPARALLCPLVPDISLKFMSPVKAYSSEPVPMAFRILNIGKGSHNHVNLELFGNCNFVSAQHAAIICDKNTGVYEIMNYSEHGTYVDGVALDCSFSDKTVSEAAVPPVLAQLKELADSNRGVRRSSEEEETVMDCMTGKTIERCGCRKSKQNRVATELPKDEAASEGWEGANRLHHGSHIKFGCIHFVFSIVETAVHGEWANDILKTYEKFVVKDTNIPMNADQQNHLS